MRTREPRPGQIGEYWLSKKPGRTGQRDPWCRTWFDKNARQTRRISLGTEDFHKASKILAEWVVANDRPKDGDSREVLIQQLLLVYWNDHGQHVHSAATQKQNLSLWEQFWDSKTVSEITPEAQRTFRDWLSKFGLKNSSIDRVLAAGKAALNYAVRQRMLDAAPFIFLVETAEEKRSREPKGDPISPVEMAQFIDAIRHRRLLVMTLLLTTTLARPEAIYDLRRIQYDPQHQQLRLNPPGRKQTKKFRPTLPVCPSLKPWLDHETAPEAYYVSEGGGPMNSLNIIWKAAHKDSGLTAKRVTPYSFRHGMAREMRKRKVPYDQIRYFMGHVPDNDTTSIYAPFDPDYCGEAVQTIEQILSEIRGYMKTSYLDSPNEPLGTKGARMRNGSLHALDRSELDKLIAEGLSGPEIGRRIGISSTAVYKRKRNLETPSK